MINKDELLYKISFIINYLEHHDGHNVKLYNRLCPIGDLEPDSDIVEYATDVEDMIISLLKYISDNCL